MTTDIELEKIIIENMTEGILQIDGHGRILYANDAAGRILGMEDDDIVGQKYGLLFLESEYNVNFVQLIIDAARMNGRICQGTVTFETDGEVRYLKTAARSEITPADGDSHDFTVTVCFQDVSAYVEENKMKDEINALNQLNRSLDLRNKLIQKIFGCFVIRQQDSSRLMTRDYMEKLGKGMEGEVTIMQSDLRGYTTLANHTGPEDVIIIMNRYIAAMADIILSHHGMIIDVVGDGIVSAFGAISHADSQGRDAVLAAIGMQRKMPEINRWLSDQRYDVHLRMGIGIDRGNTVLGFVGNGDMRSFDVMGAVIGRADEIQSNTVEGEILISGRAAQSIEAELDVETEMDLYLKRADKQIRVLKITGIGEPYHLKCPVIASRRTKLKEPVNLYFHVIKGKVQDDRKIFCRIIEISDDDMYMNCEEQLPVLTNIAADIGETLYGKLTGLDENGYIVNFTGIPPVFREWKERILNTGETKNTGGQENEKGKF